MKDCLTRVLAITAALMAPALLLAGGAGQSTGEITGTVKAPGLRDASDAVVYIASAPGHYEPSGPVELDQRDIRFAPRVAPIVAGTTVRFVNSDDVQHNVFTPSAAGDFFNLGTWPKGQAKSHTFAKMGKVDLLCNVHHEMRGYVLVLQNPFFAVTGKDGRFRIENVSPGAYQLKVWHERGTAPAVPIQVSANPVTVNFEIVAR